MHRRKGAGICDGRAVGVNGGAIISVIGGVTVHHDPTPDLDEVPWSTWPDDETVTDGRVSVGNVGNLDANGNVYALLADNTRVMVTPSVKGQDDYSYPIPGFSEVPLAITANGIALSNDVVVSGANFCVGQNIQFALGGLPNDGSVTATNFQWSFDGTYYNAYNMAVPGGTFPMCSYVSYEDAGLLKHSMLTNWWMTGGVGENTDPNTPAVYTARLSCTLVFKNNKPSQTVNISGLYNMFRPQAKVTTKTGVIGIDYNWFYADNTNRGDNVFAIHFGIPTWPNGVNSTNGQPGIVFTNSLPFIPPGGFQGDLYWVQIVNSALHQVQYVTGSIHTTVLVTNCMLDKIIPYDTANTMRTEDSPSQTIAPPGVFNAVSCSDSYSMWLVFLPDGGHVVPLRRVDWSWSATADSSTGLTSQTNTINPNGVDSIILPYWIDNSTNHMNL